MHLPKMSARVHESAFLFCVATCMYSESARVVLTIEEKMKVLDMLDNSVSYTIIAEKFGIGKSTASDLKKNKEKISRWK